MQGFKNANIYIEGKGIVRSNIQIDNGVITSFSYDSSLKTIPDDWIIVPGFIDEHIHGANGSDFMYATMQDIHNIAKSITQSGVTSFCATTMTMDDAHIKNALRTIGEYQAEDGAICLGIHLEGPFISKKYCGAQDPKMIVKPSSEKIREYSKVCADKIRIVTFAPEEAPEDFYSTLKEMKVRMSAGHTNAQASDIRFAMEHGLTQVTHMYNAMTPLHHRDVGTVGSALLSDELKTEVIADLHHVSPLALELLYKNKGKQGIILITDSIEARYLSEGIYSLGGQEVIVKDGTARLKSGTLAGSILNMNDAIFNMMNVCHLSLTDAVDMATINPAKNLGLEDVLGSIQIGKKANLTIIDKNLRVHKTIVLGKTIFEDK